MKRGMIVVAALLGIWACGRGSEDARSAADSLTRSQKDSLIADMPVPGAGAVGRALEAADRANARTQDHDTIR